MHVPPAPRYGPGLSVLTGAPLTASSTLCIRSLRAGATLTPVGS